MTSAMAEDSASSSGEDWTMSTSEFAVRVGEEGPGDGVDVEDEADWDGGVGDDGTVGVWEGSIDPGGGARVGRCEELMSPIPTKKSSIETYISTARGNLVKTMSAHME